MLFHSIKWRILAWNNALLAIVVVVLLTAFHRHERRNMLQMTDVELRKTLLMAVPGLHGVIPGFNRPGDPTPKAAAPASAALPPPPHAPARPDFSHEIADLNRLGEGPVWCAALRPDGRIAYRTANAPEDFHAYLKEWRKTLSDPGKLKELVMLRDSQRILFHAHPNGFTVIIGTPAAVLEAESKRLAWALAAAGAGLVGAVSSIGWILAGRSLRPIEKISGTAERIAGGDMTSRIDMAETESELGRLATVLNGTFDAVQASRERIVRFTADASHELRTPLAVILAGTQNALKRDRSPEEYRETVESVDRAARRMKALSDDLLELARGDAGREALQTYPCDLADLADETVAMLLPLAKQHEATLSADLESCPVEADPVRLARAIVNLTSNAILHNAPGVAVTVKTRIEGDFAVLEIGDTGRGIPQEHLEKIFDRFHRGDASRSRHTGGSGLGLAIVKQTVELHGGSIAIRSLVGAGTTFTISIPLARREA